MASRLELHEELCAILGSREVYFNPPESVKMKPKAIKYSRSGVRTFKAGGKLYTSTNRYTLIVMHPDPDDDIADRIMTHFPMCSFDRSYPSDGRIHDVLTLYY